MALAGTTTPTMAPPSSRGRVDVPVSGVLHVAWATADNPHWERLVNESILAAQRLPGVRSTLFASGLAWRAIQDKGAAHLWTDRRALTLAPSLRRFCPEYDAAADDGTQAGILRPNVYVFKLSALMASPFALTLFLDSDVLLVHPSFVQYAFDDMAGHDYASPISPSGYGLGPHGPDRAILKNTSSPFPLLCSCMIAFRSSMRPRFESAATSLLQKRYPRLVRQSDQEALWFELRQDHDAGRVRVWGLESYCPPLSTQPRLGSAADGTLMLTTSRAVNTQTLQCWAVHGHKKVLLRHNLSDDLGFPPCDPERRPLARPCFGGIELKKDQGPPAKLQKMPDYLSHRPKSHHICLRTNRSNLAGRLPTLRKEGDEPAWDAYLRNVYGGGLTYPVDLSTFSWLYHEKLPLAGVEPDRLNIGCAPRYMHAWRGYGHAESLRPAPPGFWIQQASPSHPRRSHPSHSWAEVMRATPPGWKHKDERLGTWFWEARGSGIWLHLGRTKALTMREEGGWPAALAAPTPQTLQPWLREVDTVQCPDSAAVFPVVPNSRFEIVVLPARTGDVITGGLPQIPPRKCHIQYRVGWAHDRRCVCDEAALFLRCSHHAVAAPGRWTGAGGLAPIRGGKHERGQARQLVSRPELGLRA